MRYFTFTLLIFIAFLFLSCLNKQDLPEVKTRSEEGYDKDNITLFSDQLVQLDRFENSIDTIYINRSLHLQIGAKVDHGDSISFEWKLAGIPVLNHTFSKNRHGNFWLMDSSIEADLYNQPSTLPVSVKIKFIKSGIIRERTATIHINQSTQKRDLFNLNFGMSKAEVRDNYIKLIPASLHAHFADISPNSIISQGGFLKQDFGFRLLFSDNKLTAISEIAGSTPESLLIFNEVFKKLKAPQIFKQQHDPATRQPEFHPQLPYTWTYNKIKFTVELREFEESSTIRTKYYALTYEKGI